MNALVVGADKTAILDYVPYESFLLIDDGPLIDRVMTPVARELDLSADIFNPLDGIDHKRARQLAATLYALNPQGETTLTVRNGKRALTKLLAGKPERLDGLPYDEKDDAHLEAKGLVDDLLLSPLLRRFLCGTTNLSLKGTILARLDRAKLGEEDCFAIANILIANYKGQVVVPDFGFYGCPFHVSLIRQDRLIAGVNFLDEVTDTLRNQLLLIKDKRGKRCTAKDAETLADYCGLSREAHGYKNKIEEYLA